MTQSLGVALILTALRDHRQAANPAMGTAGDRAHGANAGSARSPSSSASLLGVLVTLSSVGAGALGVAALFFLYPRLSTVEIVGTDIAHAVPLTLVAGLGHAQLGTVDWGLLGSLLSARCRNLARQRAVGARAGARCCGPGSRRCWW